MDWVFDLDQKLTYNNPEFKKQCEKRNIDIKDLDTGWVDQKPLTSEGGSSNEDDDDSDMDNDKDDLFAAQQRKLDRMRERPSTEARTMSLHSADGNTSIPFKFSGEKTKPSSPIKPTEIKPSDLKEEDDDDSEDLDDDIFDDAESATSEETKDEVTELTDTPDTNLKISDITKPKDSTADLAAILGLSLPSENKSEESTESTESEDESDRKEETSNEPKVDNTEVESTTEVEQDVKSEDKSDVPSDNALAEKPTGAIDLSAAFANIQLDNYSPTISKKDQIRAALNEADTKAPVIKLNLDLTLENVQPKKGAMIKLNLSDLNTVTNNNNN